MKALSKKLLKTFQSRLKFSGLQSEKKPNFRRKKAHKCPLHTKKWETELFFGEFSQRLKDFRPKKKMKKHFLLEKIPNSSSAHLLSFFERRTGVFLPKNWHKKAQVPHKKVEESRKNQDAVFPVLIAPSEALLKTFLPNREYLGSQSKTVITFRGKTSPKNLLRTKVEKLGLLSQTFQSKFESFLLEVHDSKVVSFGKILPNVPLHKYSEILRSESILLNSNCKKNCPESEEKNNVFTKKTNGTIFCTNWMHFRNNFWKLFSQSSKIQAYSPKKT